MKQTAVEPMTTLVQDIVSELRRTGLVSPDGMGDVAAVASLLKHLAAAGVIDRAHSVRVGNVEVHLGPADLPADIAKGDPNDPTTRIKRMIYQLGIRDERGQ